MTEAEVLSVILLNEGGFKNEPDKDPADPTNFGITAQTLGDWRKLGRRATVEEVLALTPEEAKQIYRKIYIEDPGFTTENIPYEPLRLQLIDFGVNSGPATAIRWLQRVLQLTPTGVLDADMGMWLDLLHHHSIKTTGIDVWPILNDALVGARSYMIDRLDDAGKLAEKYEEGVESRALSFLVSKPEQQPTVSSDTRRA